MKKQSAFLGILSVIGLLQACSDNRPPEEIVRERALERLELLMAGDIKKAYEKFLTDSYKERTSLLHYSSRVGGAGSWTSVDIKSVACEEETCQVRTMVGYHMKGTRVDVEDVLPIDEKWIKIKKKWYLYSK